MTRPTFAVKVLPLWRFRDTGAPASFTDPPLHSASDCAAHDARGCRGSGYMVPSIVATIQSDNAGATVA